jgi:hypothetical protein
MENGQEVTRENTVPVQPGQTATVHFEQSSNERIQPAADTRTTPPAPVAPAEQGALPFEGRVQRAGENDIVVTDRDGNNARTYRLGTDAQIMIDGRKGQLSDLRPGMQVSVTPQGFSGGFSRLEATSTGGAQPSRTNEDRTLP